MEPRQSDPVELMWRMAKIAGSVDTLVRLIETVIQARPTLRFHGTAGKELAVRDLAGLARSIQAASSVPQGRAIEDADVRDLERRYASVEAEVKLILAQLAAGNKS